MNAPIPVFFDCHRRKHVMCLRYEAHPSRRVLRALTVSRFRHQISRDLSQRQHAKYGFHCVDLPAPLGPTMTAISPFSTPIEQSCKISVAPYPPVICSPSKKLILFFMFQSSTEIGFNDLLIIFDFLNRALGENCPFSHTDHWIT